MSSRAALRIALVCLAMIASGAAALAAEPTSEVLVPAPDPEARAAAASPEAEVQAAPDPVATKNRPGKDWLGTAMNAGAIAFCVWMVALLWRPGLGRSLMVAKKPGRR